MPVPDFAPGEVLTAAAMDSIGLWLVKTQTIGTAVSSVTVTGAFSSTYQNYKIILSGGVSSVSTNINLRLGASTTGYYSVLLYSQYNSAVAQSFTDNNGAQITRAGTGSTSNNFANIEIQSPNEAKVTGVSCFYYSADPLSGAGTSTGFHNSATAHTDFTLINASGTFTGGTIRVYGYRN